MSNNLDTVLDDAGGRALVEKYLRAEFLERADYDTVLANADFGTQFNIPEKSGQYVEATRKGFFRMPQNVPNATPESDPASGATMAAAKVKLPMEFIHEFAGVGTIAQMTNWIDLENWAKEDMPIALIRRRHQLVQNAIKFGRMTPGVWAANGTASTPFDASVEATPTIYGITWDFKKGVEYFVNKKTAHAALNEQDRHKIEDYKRIVTRMANTGVRKIKGKYVAVISEAIQMDLMKDDQMFAASIHAFNGKGIREGQISDYAGIHWIVDDEPMTLEYGAANKAKRATYGPIHVAQIFGANSFAYLSLGKGKNAAVPKFKVQDITKTGGEKTIGYTVPNQVGVIDATACATLSGPVTEYATNA